MLKRFVSHLARYNGSALNVVLTLLGLAAAWVSTAEVDWAKVMAGDPTEIRKVGTAAVLALLGWLAHKAPQSKPE